MIQETLRAVISCAGSPPANPCAMISSRASTRIFGRCRAKTIAPGDRRRTPPIATVHGAPMRSATAPGEQRADRRHAHEHHRVDRHRAAAQPVGHHRLDQRVRRRPSAPSSRIPPARAGARTAKYQRENAKRISATPKRRRRSPPSVPRPCTLRARGQRQRARQRADSRGAHQTLRAFARCRAECAPQKSASAPSRASPRC